MENSKKKNGNKNPYIESMNEDVLYHIGLSSGSQDLKAMFGDIKVCNRRPVPSTDQAIPSCFYFRIS